MIHRGKPAELLAKREIEDREFVVHDANIVLLANCPNIDLIVYAKTGAIYVQVKSSERPAGADCVIVHGAPWTEEQLFHGAPFYNKHDHYKASIIVIVDKLKSGEVDFYVAPPEPIEALARTRSLEFAKRPKRDGTQRAITFRKELRREQLKEWKNAWHLLGEPAVRATI